MAVDYQTILFDLDGTIINSKIGVTHSVQYALKQFGIGVADLQLLERFIGPMLVHSFQEFYHFSKKDALQAVDYYREYYSEKGVYQNEVYAGIPELLEELKAHNKTLAIATKKPTYYAKIILEDIGLTHYFAEIAGSNMDHTRSTKQEIIAFVLEQIGQKSDVSMVMIGDRKYDIGGAKACGIDGIGVLYGFGSQEELEEEVPIAMVNSVDELRKYLLE